MKLRKSQRHVVHVLLSYMSDPDVMSLARTITNNLVPITSSNDAKEAIILHEVDIQALLSRRKITREILFKYLHDNNVNIPANSDKSQLMNTFIVIWQKQLSKVQSNRPQLNPTRYKAETVSEVNHPQLNPGSYKAETVLEVNRPQLNPANYKTETVSEVNVHVGDVNMLTMQFISWFYGILNDCITSQKSDKLCKEHFWNDCSLHLVMESPLESVVKDIHNNSEDVVRVLQEVQMQHKLYFNPNISSSGIRGKVDIHGLVMVMACGTLHQVDSCVGVFQQVFGLVRDPFMENNWRIKSTSVILRSQQMSRVPVLEHECFKSLPLPQ